MQQDTPVELIVGLGNPGTEYAGTRHNAGFDVVSRLLQRLPGEFKPEHRCESRCFDGRFRGRALTFQLPQTYMNLSGLAVAGLARKRSIAPEAILVISDDLDLPVGRLRVRRGGSAGGHHGLESVMKELGSAGFVRLRVGIGRTKPGGTVDHVLGRVEGDELPQYEEALDRAADAVIAILTAGVSRAMNQFNVRLPESETKQNSDGSTQRKTTEA